MLSDAEPLAPQIPRAIEAGRAAIYDLIKGFPAWQSPPPFEFTLHGWSFATTFNLDDLAATCLSHMLVTAAGGDYAAHSCYFRSSRCPPLPTPDLADFLSLIALHSAEAYRKATRDLLVDHIGRPDDACDGYDDEEDTESEVKDKDHSLCGAAMLAWLEMPQAPTSASVHRATLSITSGTSFDCRRCLFRLSMGRKALHSAFRSFEHCEGLKFPLPTVDALTEL